MWHPLIGWKPDGSVTESARPHPPGFTCALAGHLAGMFFLFSSRLGCLGSLAVSALLTVLLLLFLDVL